MRCLLTFPVVALVLTLAACGDRDPVRPQPAGPAAHARRGPTPPPSFGDSTCICLPIEPTPVDSAIEMP